MVKKQLVLIGGGITFRSRKDYISYLKTRPVSIEKKVRWHQEYLDNKLNKHFDIIRLQMPSSDNAKYSDWKINFERYIPLLKNGVVLVGNSLGGMFLAKYLSENKFSKKINSVIMIAAPYDGSLSNEDLVGGFRLNSDLSLITKNCRDINFFFSEDDDVVLINHATKYARRLPLANFFILKSAKGHFQAPEFPELIELLKKKLD